MTLQGSRPFRPWTPDDGSPPPCCGNCQLMLETVEDRAQRRFDADFRKSIGRQHDCSRPPVTPTHTPQTSLHTPQTTAETTPRSSVV